MIRTVVDLNVLVSALISPAGTPGRMIAQWRRGGFTLLLSRPMLATLNEALSEPRLRRRVSQEDAQHLLHDLGSLASVTPGEMRVAGIVRDPDDDEVIACAVEGGADYIVSGDDELLILGTYKGIPILRPAAFVRLIEEQYSMSRLAYLALGTNLGDREAYLRDAVARLAATPGVNFRRGSCVYETEPVGPQDQPKYLNMVVEVEIGEEVTARGLLRVAKRIETELGRQRRQRWGPREIDIDVLWVAGEQVREGDLEVPHPRMWERAFVLAPLAELAPDLRAPGGETAATLAERLSEEQGVAVYVAGRE